MASTPRFHCLDGAAIAAFLILCLCALSRSQPIVLRHRSRRAAVARAREGIAHLALDVEGPAGRALTVGLGVRCPSVFKDAQRGCTERDRCELLLVAP